MKRLRYSWIIFLTLGFASCGDAFFNDTEPSTYIPTSDVWSDSLLVRSVMAQLYSNLEVEDFFYLSKEPQPGIDIRDEYRWNYVIASHITLGCASDESWPAWDNGALGVNGKEQVIYDGSWFYTYGKAYIQIHNCNNYLNQLDSAAITENERTSMKAEIRFIRAFHYFQLVKRLGGVPLITQVQKYTGEQDLLKFQVPRNQEKEIWDFIDTEINDIVQILPGSRDAANKNRANKYMAYALQSRAMLYAASVAKYGQYDPSHFVGINADPNIYYQKAIIASDEVLNCPNYELYGLNGSDEPESRSANYTNLFLDKTNKEYIMAREYIIPGVTHMFDFYQTPFSFANNGYGCGMSPTLELVEAFEYRDGSPGTLKTIDKEGAYIEYANPLDLFNGKDPRLAASVYLPMGKFKESMVEIRCGVAKNLQKPDRSTWGITYADMQKTENLAFGPIIRKIGKDGIIDKGDPTNTGFYQKKFYNEQTKDLSEAGTMSDQSWPVFRLAEMYLNKAEAAMEMGNVPVALEAIYPVRKRAGVVEMTMFNISLDRIRNERRIELVFENHRFWDLRRWRIAATPRADTGGQGVLDNLAPTALYPWAVYEKGTSTDIHGNVVANSYIFSKESEEIKKPDKVFLSRNYYLKFQSEDLNSNPNLVQNPGY